MTREELVSEIQKELDKCLTGEEINWELIEKANKEIEEIDKEFKRLFL